MYWHVYLLKQLLLHFATFQKLLNIEQWRKCVNYIFDFYLKGIENK